MSDRKPKLLIVTTAPGTLAAILKGQPKWLAQHFDVALATNPEPRVKVVEANEGISVRAVAMNRGISPLKDLKSIVNMVSVIRREKPDIMHSYTPKAGLVAMIAGVIARVPVRVHTFTGLIFPTSTGMKKKILIAVDRLICKAATHVVPEGQGVKDDLINARITQKPLEVIGHGNIAGVNTSQFDPQNVDVVAGVAELSKEHSIPENAFVFGFAGRLNKDKGLNELSAAFAAVADENTWLICAGDIDQTAPLSDTTLDLLKTHPRVIMTGFISDVRPLMARADAMILASYREGFPNVLLQAAAMGTPLIGTDISGSNEIIDEGENGYIIPVRDADGLAVAMKKLMVLEPVAKAKMGASGRKKVVSYYEQSVLRNALLAFYHETLARGR